MKRQIVLDTETTGLSAQNGDRIIEIGCIELVDRRFTGRSYHQYINPQRAIDVGAQAVHGISSDFLKDKPVFSDVADAFFEFCDGAELVIHNAPFDIGFINAEFQHLKYKCKDITKKCEVLDSLLFARQKHPGQANSLDALCKRYSVDASGREYHGALLDAQLLAHVYLAMTSEQTTLFGRSSGQPQKNNQKTAETSVAPVQVIAPEGLRVIKANEEELKAHNAFVAQFQE
jgi:DNA polymerase-3 subunit epsilon